jgi:hypothetical protein
MEQESKSEHVQGDRLEATREKTDAQPTNTWMTFFGFPRPFQALKETRLNLQIPFKIPSVDFLDSLATAVDARFLDAECQLNWRSPGFTIKPQKSAVIGSTQAVLNRISNTLFFNHWLSLLVEARRFASLLYQGF